MIIDYNYPTIVGDRWQVVVHQTDKKGKLRTTVYKDETKDCAFDTYEMIHQAYLKQKQNQR